MTLGGLAGLINAKKGLTTPKDQDPTPEETKKEQPENDNAGPTAAPPADEPKGEKLNETAKS